MAMMNWFAVSVNFFLPLLCLRCFKNIFNLLIT